MKRLVALLFLLVVPAAHADGDPASDVLLAANVFLPYPAPSSAAAGALDREVGAAYSRGHRVKVAVIASEQDLGAIPSLFGKPQEYAKFLGQELQLYYVGPLLIVMHAGYGIYDGGRSTLRVRKVLAGVDPPGPSADELTTGAAGTVRKLLAAGALESKDIKAPYAAALSGMVTRGRTAKLHYAVFDDSGKTKERLAVRDGSNKVIAMWSTPLRTTAASKTYSVSWTVPRNAPKNGVRFCLAAYDATGNHADSPSCAAVVVK
jgi:hypothetical protein